MPSFAFWNRILWNLLSTLAIIAASLALFNSWVQPPPQTKLDLFQLDFSLNASLLLEDLEYQALARPLLGMDTLPSAIQRYEAAAKTLKLRLANLQPPPALVAESEVSLPPSQTVKRLQKELDTLTLRLGILQVAQGDETTAKTLWQSIMSPELIPTALVLQGFWDDPPRILPEAEQIITSELEGWFANRAFEKLYTLRQDADALASLAVREKDLAVSSFLRLVLVAGFPLLGLIFGTGILIGLIIWSLWQRKPLVGSEWVIPWSGEAIQRVLTGWFLSFLLLGWLTPKLYSLVMGDDLTYWQQALELLLTYTSGAIAGGGLIYGAVRSYRPLIPQELFQIRFQLQGILWGLAGYFMAMPLVVLASLLSQSLFTQGGGGNPILPIILASEGWIPRILFFIVVAVAAPIFEEFLFRGFFLTSLTRYLPTWGAILLSSVTFAVAHLNFSDLIPLTMLGMVLGFTYSRSRNLLTPMILHSFWNGGTLVSLLVLAKS
jgi:membrane protease YdiL (CAAX protease family)